MAKKNKLNIKTSIGKIDQSKEIIDSEIDLDALREDIDNDVTANSLEEFNQSVKVKGSKVQKTWIWALIIILGAAAGIIAAIKS